jgi:hypothetical protein
MDQQSRSSEHPEGPPIATQQAPSRNEMFRPVNYEDEKRSAYYHLRKENFYPSFLKKVLAIPT